MQKSVICLKRTHPSMPLVRICMVSMTLLRLFMCMCIRARIKERKRKREPPETLNSNDEQSCGSMIELCAAQETCVVTEAKPDLNLSVAHSFLSKKRQTSAASTSARALFKREFEPEHSKTIPHQALFDHKRRQVWQAESLHQHLQRWLLRLWRWKGICQRNEAFDRFQPVSHPQVESEIAREGKEFYSTGDGSRVTTIAWAEPSEGYEEMETPSCSYRQDSVKKTLNVREFERTLKTLVDEFLARGEVGSFSYKECLAYFGDTCPCRFLLPNQIVNMDFSYPVSTSTLPLSLPAAPLSETSNSIEHNLKFTAGLKRKIES